jgi:hypothetical protein
MLPPGAVRLDRFQAIVFAAIVALLVAGCSGRSTSNAQQPARLDGCEGCTVRSVVGWRDGGHSVLFIVTTPDKKLRRYAIGTDATGLRMVAKRVRRPARVWTRNRSRVAYVKDEVIVVRSRDGRRIGSPTNSCPTEDACYDEVFDSAPSWSPDGRWLLFTRSASDFCGFCFAPGFSFFTALGVARPDGTGFHWVTIGEEADNDTSGSWSPDGSLIAFVREGSLYIVEVDRRGTEGLPPRPVVVP